MSVYRVISGQSRPYYLISFSSNNFFGSIFLCLGTVVAITLTRLFLVFQVCVFVFFLWGIFCGTVFCVFCGAFLCVFFWVIYFDCTTWGQTVVITKKLISYHSPLINFFTLQLLLENAKVNDSIFSFSLLPLNYQLNIPLSSQTRHRFLFVSYVDLILIDSFLIKCEKIFDVFPLSSQ